MNSEFEKYLKTEREISLFRIESLKKMLSKNEASTRRLLAIEEEFLKIPFEKISSSLPELLSAIKIFRDSRAAFYEMYSLPSEEERGTEDSNLMADCLGLLEIEISKISEERFFDNIKDFRSNGRLLTILLCIHSYLFKTMQEVEDRNINVSPKDLLSEISQKYSQDIFSIYNQIISDLDLNLLKSQKSKEAVKFVKPLSDISGEFESVFFEIRTERAKGKTLFGFFLPAKHIGRETMRPYHLRLLDEDGFNISKLFNMQARSVFLKEKNEYYKFISLVSLDEIKDNLVLLDRYQFLMKKIFHNKLSGRPGVRVDIKKSSILIPASRTEDEGLKEALSSASAIFSNILTKLI